MCVCVVWMLVEVVVVCDELSVKKVQEQVQELTGYYVGRVAK
jgi:hypothetical protein